MNSHFSAAADPLNFLADAITNGASNDGMDTILTQPPEDAAAAPTEVIGRPNKDATTETLGTPAIVNNENINNGSVVHDTSSTKQQTDASAQPTKRKSKLKKANRQSSKSVLETMSGETSAAMTTAAAGTAKAPPTNNSNGNKQKNQHDTAAKPPAVAPTKQAPTTISKTKLLSQITIGTKLDVYWTGDEKYYSGIVTSHQPGKGRRGGQYVYNIQYDDGDSETVDLATEKFRIVEVGAPSNDVNEADDTQALATESKEALLAVQQVSQLRTNLDTLRLNKGSNGKARTPTKKILSILTELDNRDDIDFHTLFHTGIGKAVNKLTKKQTGKNSKVSQAATPLLMKWRMIDESTPEEVKASVKQQAASSVTSNLDGTSNDGGCGGNTSAKTPAAAANAARASLSPTPTKPAVGKSEEAIDLTSSPSLSKVQSSIASKANKKQKGELAAAKITPASTKVDESQVNEKKRSMPPPPDLEMPPSSNDQEAVEVQTSKKKKKAKSSNSASKSTFGAPAQQPAAASNVEKLTSAKPQPVAKKQPATAKPSNTKQPSPVTNSTASTQMPNVSTTTVKPGSSTAASSIAPAKEPPKKKKKRNFNDQILYRMLTTCKPYTLKSLAKEANTTVEALRHVMLSFLDKKVVICKEFPSKKDSSREPKKLYYANPLSLSEVESGSVVGNGKGKKGGGGAVMKELSKLLSSSEEINETRQERQQLEQQLRAIHAELTPLLAIPTMKELDDQISAEEQKLQSIQKEIQAVKDRMTDAVKPAASAPGRTNIGGYGGGAAYYPANRFKKAPTKPQSPTTLKRKINHMLGEYKTRKRKCMDFVGELSDAMEKKIKDVVGDKVLMLDTDEMEWGCYEDCTTGKVYGTKPKAKQMKGPLVSRKKAGLVDGQSDGPSIVKIPAKYQDV